MLYNKPDVQGHSLSYRFVRKLIIHQKVPCTLFYSSKSCKVVNKGIYYEKNYTDYTSNKLNIGVLEINFLSKIQMNLWE